MKIAHLYAEQVNNFPYLSLSLFLSSLDFLFAPTHTHRKRSELIIRSFNTSDAGRYECRAKNKVNQTVVGRAIVVKAYPGIYFD